MRIIPILFFAFLLALPANGQRMADYGVLAGIMSYHGDINPSRLIHSPGPAGGLFYRYNLHPRQSIRASFMIGSLSANDLAFDNSYQQARAASFSGMVSELALQFEFNFFPYSTAGKRWNYTPYIAAGGAASFVNTNEIVIVPVIPFSAGFKINIYKNIGLEAEYGFRKTFYDNFDGLKDPTDPSDYPWLHNNDWYMFGGIGLTWKMYNRLAGCPAYGDTDRTRKKK
jgi:hypothetical protein